MASDNHFAAIDELRSNSVRASSDLSRPQQNGRTPGRRSQRRRLPTYIYKNHASHMVCYNSATCPRHLLHLVDLVKFSHSHFGFLVPEQPLWPLSSVISLETSKTDVQHVHPRRKDERRQNASSCDQNLRQFMHFPISYIPSKMPAAYLLDVHHATPPPS